MDSTLYKAAAKGEIDPFDTYTEPLNLLLTPTKNTILHIHSNQQPIAANVSISFVKQILAKCPPLLLQTNSRGETPLHMAARHGHHTLVRFLIDYTKSTHQDIEIGASAARTMLRMDSIAKETALHEAVRHNNPAVVHVLTVEDPDYTYTGNQLEETPLYLAVERGNCNIVFQILNTCSSPAFHGPNGRTVLHEAVIRNNSEMTAKVTQANETLLKEVDQQGWTPLHHASHSGHLAIVRQLLECDRSVAYIGDSSGMIPLHIAAACGDSHEQVVYTILEHCPDCHELVDHKGRNVLHFLVLSRSRSMWIDLLIGSNNNGCYLPLLTNLMNQKDVDGNTPLHLTASYCFANPIVIEHPLADKMAINNNNSTPRDIVSESSEDHDEGLKAFTLRSMERAGGYKQSLRKVFELKDSKPEVIETELMEKMKTSHIIVAALIATVTFTAGFTMPGGYDGDDGVAILSRNSAFVTFIITDTLAFIFSTCALFFYYSMEFGLTKRSTVQLLKFAALLIMLSVFLMVIAFTAAVFAVLHSSTYLRVIICVVTSFSILICYSPLKHYLAHL